MSHKLTANELTKAFNQFAGQPLDSSLEPINKLASENGYSVRFVSASGFHDNSIAANRVTVVVDEKSVGARIQQIGLY